MCRSPSLSLSEQGLEAGPAVLPLWQSPQEPRLADHTWAWRNTESRKAGSTSRDTGGPGRDPELGEFSGTFGYGLQHGVPPSQSLHCVGKGQPIEGSPHCCSVGSDTDRLCCQAQPFPRQQTQSQVNASLGGNGRDQDVQGQGGAAERQMLFRDLSPHYSTESIQHALWDGNIISVLQWSKLRYTLSKFMAKWK